MDCKLRPLDTEYLGRSRQGQAGFRFRAVRNRWPVTRTWSPGAAHAPGPGPEPSRSGQRPLVPAHRGVRETSEVPCPGGVSIARALLPGTRGRLTLCNASCREPRRRLSRLSRLAVCNGSTRAGADKCGRSPTARMRSSRAGRRCGGLQVDGRSRQPAGSRSGHIMILGSVTLLLMRLWGSTSPPFT